MNKRLCALTFACLLLAGCKGTEPSTTTEAESKIEETTVVSESVESTVSDEPEVEDSSTVSESEESAEPETEPEIEAVGEDVELLLKTSIEEQCGGAIREYKYLDFDLNGTYEMFAITESDTLWFANENVTELVSEDGNMSGFLYATTREGNSFVYTSGIAMGCGEPVYALYTANGDDYLSYEENLSNLRYIDNQFYILDEVGESRSLSPLYPVKWGTDSFVDYEIKEIAKADLSSYDPDNIISLPDNITDIFMRGDSWLHINYRTSDGNDASKTFLMDNGIVTKDVSDDVSGNYGNFVVSTIKRTIC